MLKPFPIIADGLDRIQQGELGYRLPPLAGEEASIIGGADDGVGLPADWSKPGHFGLRGLTDRVSRIGGSFHVGNQDGGGARLTALIPLSAA